MCHPALRLAVFSIFCSAAVPAQLQWRSVLPTSQVSVTPLAPACYDEVRDRTVLVTGYRPQGGMLTWEWDGSTWRERTPTVRPAWRGGHAMAYDSVRQRVLLFGGSEGRFLADTWEWDGVDWSQIAAPGPSPRHDHALAFDPRRGRAVMFGGLFSTTLLGDTWEWDGTRWFRQHPPNQPSARHLHGMAYDEARGEVVLFGGNDPDAGQALGDTWTWDGTDWTRRSPPTSPPARSAFYMTYDRARQRVVFVGGLTASSQDRAVWEWDGTTWLERSTSGGPGPRNCVAVAYDAQRRQLVAFGGYDGNAWNTDTWLLEPTHPADFSAYGTGCPGRAGAIELAPTDGALPWLGETVTLEVTGLTPGDSHPVSLFVGGSRAAFGQLPLPFDLASIGMAGCSLWTSIEVVLPLARTGGSARVDVALPAALALAGRAVFFQAAVADPAANALGVAMSNAGQATLGAR